MLRFDIPPVCSNAYRLQAAMSFAIAAVYLFTPYQWISALLAFGGLWRGFVSPHRCLSYRLFAWITERLGWRKPVNAGAKLFADKIAGIAGAAMFVSWWLGSSLGNIPAVAILIFAAADALTGFCVACWAYALWYRVRAA